MKKNNPIQLSIPQPCAQDWNAMTPDAKGRFCAHCQKSVVDFTNWTDTDLHRFFSKNNQSVCGRFQADQLNRTIELPVQKPTRMYRIAIALGLSLVFNELPANAQHRSPMFPHTAHNMLLTKNDSSGTYNLDIKGTVIDGWNQPAINAIVNIEQNGKSIGGAATDIDGKFQIPFDKIADTSDLWLNVLYTDHIPLKISLDTFRKTETISLKLSTEKPKYVIIRRQTTGLVSAQSKNTERQSVNADSIVIRGTVLGYKNRPVPGALVYARLRGEYLNYTYADTSGHFELMLHHPLYLSDTVTIFCYADPYFDEVQQWNISNKGPITIHLQTAGHGTIVRGISSSPKFSKPRPGAPPTQLPALTPDQIKRLTNIQKH